MPQEVPVAKLVRAARTKVSAGSRPGLSNSRETVSRIPGGLHIGAHFLDHPGHGQDHHRQGQGAEPHQERFERLADCQQALQGDQGQR